MTEMSDTLRKPVSSSAVSLVSPYRRRGRPFIAPGLLGAERLSAPGSKHDVWRCRCREINDWERYLAGNGIHVVKSV